MNYSIIRKDLDSFLVTTVAYATISIKVIKINPHTKVEEVVTITLSDNVSYTQSNNYYVITTTEATDIPVTLSSDGVYFIYVQDDGITYKHLLVNTKKVTDYITTTAQNNICCCPIRDCKHTVFSNKDYVFNVISNLCFSYLGWEFDELSVDYSSTSGNYNTELEQRIYLASEILFRVNEYLLSDTSNLCQTC